MNFDGVKSITIPEGNVKKIMRGDEVLWEKPATYECNPTITLRCNSVQNHTGSSKSYNVTYGVSGISRHLIVSLDLVTHMELQTTFREVSSSATMSVPSDADTVIGYYGGYSATVSTTMYYFNGFSLRLKYKDESGNELTLTTNRVTNSGGETSASA